MNLILGSGITGLLAKYILGEDWTVIPFYKSRFYSYTPPLCDNFIIADPQIDDIITALGYATTHTLLARAYSSQGQLYRQDQNGALATSYLHKLFNGSPPSQSIPYYKARNTFFVYEHVRINKLYAKLLNDYGDQLQQQAVLGHVKAIGDHYLERVDGSRVEFERVVSTIPLKVLMGLLGQSCNLQFRPIHYIHMETKSLDFEGASQLLVVDQLFSFFKVSAIAKNRYMFYCHESIPNAGQYFMPIVPGDYDLIDGTMVPDALPLGELPNLDWLGVRDIFPVGSFAQHDFCADVGSNILKLVRYAGRDYRFRRSLPNGLKELTV